MPITTARDQWGNVSHSVTETISFSVSTDLTAPADEGAERMIRAQLKAATADLHPLRDSLGVLRQRIAEEESTVATLSRQIDALGAKAEKLRDNPVHAADYSGVIAQRDRLAADRDRRATALAQMRRAAARVWDTAREHLAKTAVAAADATGAHARARAALATALVRWRRAVEQFAEEQFRAGGLAVLAAGSSSPGEASLRQVVAELLGDRPE